MEKLVDWEPDCNYKTIRCKIPGKVIMDNGTKEFMKLFAKEYGVKFINVDNGEEIKVDES